MDKALELDMFQKLKNQSHLHDWCRDEAAAVVKTLMNSPDPVAIHRAQGRAQLLAEMVAMMEKPRAS